MEYSSISTRRIVSCGLAMRWHRTQNTPASRIAGRFVHTCNNDLSELSTMVVDGERTEISHCGAKDVSGRRVVWQYRGERSQQDAQPFWHTIFSDMCEGLIFPTATAAAAAASMLRRPHRNPEVDKHYCAACRRLLQKRVRLQVCQVRAWKHGS